MSMNEDYGEPLVVVSEGVGSSDNINLIRLLDFQEARAMAASKPGYVWQEWLLAEQHIDGFDNRSLEDWVVTVKDLVAEVRAQEAVNHPAHYGGEDNPYEAIKVIEAWGLDRDFCLGNTLKYIARHEHKDPAKRIEDLEKARWYLDRRIQRLKSGS